MKLSTAEFDAMNGRIRRFSHRHIEFRIFSRLGLGACAGKDVVELGCGNGLGAELIATTRPRSYVGIDFMAEQITLAETRNIPNARFMTGDASSLELADGCADVVVIFGILHHVQHWQQAVSECRRILRPGGVLLVEEPDESALHLWDRVFRWDHPRAGFTLGGLEHELGSGGLRLEKRWKIPAVFGFYRARKGSA